MLPASSSENVKGGRFAFSAEVALDKIDLLGRNEKNFVLSVLKFNVVSFPLTRNNPLNAAVNGDAVIDMNHVIAFV